MCIATSNRNTDDPARQFSTGVCIPLEDKRQLRPDIVRRVYESVNQVRYAFVLLVTATLNWQEYVDTLQDKANNYWSPDPLNWIKKVITGTTRPPGWWSGEGLNCQTPVVDCIKVPTYPSPIKIQHSLLT